MAPSRPDIGLNRLPSSELMSTLEQVDVAARAQVPLVQGIRALAEEASSARTRRVLDNLADLLERGESLGDAVALAGDGLSPALQILVERRLPLQRFDTLLHWTVEQQKRSGRVKRQLWGSLAYPVLLVSVAILIGSIFLFSIAPMFGTIFDDFGTELPLVTQVVVNFARFGRANWIPCLATTVLLITTAGLFFISGGNWIVSQRWSGSIPLIGPLFRLVALTDFCHLLAVFVEAGLPLHQGIRYAGESTSDRWLQHVCADVSSDIASGIISDSSAMAAGLPQAISQMLRESTSAESLSDALHGLGDIYEARVQVGTRLIAAFVEPFVLVFTCVGLRMMVGSLFVPLFRMLNDLS
jgi:type IV pilus assembly protein PilC